MGEALIVVDVQNDFAHRDGNLFVSGGDKIVYDINNIMQRGWDLVVCTQDWHPESTSHFEQWPVHCVAGTWGAEFHEELEVSNATVVQKGYFENADGYSGFSQRIGDTVFETPLHEVLQDSEIDGVVVVGIALDVCVYETAMDALKLGYKVKVLPHFTAAVDEQDGYYKCRNMEDAGIEVVWW